ncbi:papilin isoform X1, putative [Babesia ovata]|uniref:Papilin isoform X1, putative n=1 Tax=Babesia ovata TaxID=189622 RepID=A0A2H6KIE8_9APIC|nr:papilin isoform X1, putative [Babesia ovata]GBE62767.1 papilin isoform X1, putative [Babesia ovata]
MQQQDEMRRAYAIADDAKRYSVIAEDALRVVFPQSSKNNFHVIKLLFDTKYANDAVNTELWEGISAKVNTITEGNRKINAAAYEPAPVESVKTGVLQYATVLQDFDGYEKRVSQINIVDLRRYLDDLMKSSELHMQLKMLKALPPYWLNDVKAVMLIRKLSAAYGARGHYNFTGPISEALKGVADPESPETKDYQTWINRQRAHLQQLAVLLTKYDVEKTDETCSSPQCLGYTDSANVALWYELYSAMDEQTVLMRSVADLKAAIRLTFARRGKTGYGYHNLNKIASILTDVLPHRVMTEEERNEFEAKINLLRESMAKAAVANSDAAAPEVTDEAVLDHFDPTLPHNASHAELTLLVVYTKSLLRDVMKDTKYVRANLTVVSSGELIPRDSSSGDLRSGLAKLQVTTDVIRGVIDGSKSKIDEIDAYSKRHLTSSANEYISEYVGSCISKRAHRVFANTSAVRGLMLDFYADLHRTFVPKDAKTQVHAPEELLNEMARLVSESCRALDRYLGPYVKLRGSVSMDMAKVGKALASITPSAASSTVFESMRARYDDLKDEMHLVLNQFGDLITNAERVRGLLRFVKGNVASESGADREQLWHAYFELRADIHNGILLGASFESIGYRREMMSHVADRLISLAGGDSGSSEESRGATTPPAGSVEDAASPGAGDASASSAETAVPGVEGDASTDVREAAGEQYPTDKLATENMATAEPTVDMPSTTSSGLEKAAALSAEQPGSRMSVDKTPSALKVTTAPSVVTAAPSGDVPASKEEGNPSASAASNKSKEGLEAPVNATEPAGEGDGKSNLREKTASGFDALCTCLNAAFVLGLSIAVLG